MEYSPILKNVTKHISLDNKETSFFISLLKYQKVARLESVSKWADEDVKIAKERGLKIYHRLKDVPHEA